MKTRTRECDRRTKDLECVGDESQTLDCAKWRCPSKQIALKEECLDVKHISYFQYKFSTAMPVVVKYPNNVVAKEQI